MDVRSFHRRGVMWLRSDTILWTGIGMNTATTPALVLRTRTEPEALEAAFLAPVPNEVKL